MKASKVKRVARFLGQHYMLVTALCFAFGQLVTGHTQEALSTFFGALSGGVIVQAVATKTRPDAGR